MRGSNVILSSDLTVVSGLAAWPFTRMTSFSSSSWGRRAISLILASPHISTFCSRPPGLSRLGTHVDELDGVALGHLEAHPSPLGVGAGVRVLSSI